MFDCQYLHFSVWDYDLQIHENKRICPFYNWGEIYEIAGVEHEGGDMFESVPEADAIFMKVSWNIKSFAHVLVQVKLNLKFLVYLICSWIQAAYSM